MAQNCCCRQQAAVRAGASIAALLSCQRTQFSHVQQEIQVLYFTVTAVSPVSWFGVVHLVTASS